MATRKNKIFKDEQTDKRIHEHLANENDVISEEDIKNVKTSIKDESSSDSTNEDENLLEKEQDIANDNTQKDDGDAPRIETPWNILE